MYVSLTQVPNKIMMLRIYIHCMYNTAIIVNPNAHLNEAQYFLLM